MNIVVGNNSQLAHYFPNDYLKVSSRNISKSSFTDRYESVYLTFAEQRTFNRDLTESDFFKVNVDYTEKVIDILSSRSEKVILFGTSELWNNCSGPIDINTPINYRYSPYVKSKELLWDKIRERRITGDWGNVFIIHPFNFNSIYRKEGFLFYKFFDSLINKNINEVGNINIDRDIIHPKYLVNKSITCEGDLIVGSGKTTNIKEFIKNLFDYYNMEMGDFIIEKDFKSQHQDNKYWLNTESIYNDLVNDTISELNIVKNEKYQTSQ